MSEGYRIYDDRTNETLFTGNHFECMARLSVVDEENEVFPHLWIGKVESESNE